MEIDFVNFLILTRQKIQFNYFVVFVLSYRGKTTITITTKNDLSPKAKVVFRSTT